MSKNFQGRTMQEYLIRNKCSTTYENTDLCIWYESLTLWKDQETPQPLTAMIEVLWNDPYW